MKRQLQATVIGNSDKSDNRDQLAYQIGKFLAISGFITITGGRGGVMEAVAKGVHEHGGISVGILPTEGLAEGNEFNTITIPTGIGFARNSMNVLAADFVIAIGGGAGTLSEIAFAWVYDKPVFCYTESDGWAKELAEKNLDQRKSGLLKGFSNLDELQELIEQFRLE